MNDPEVCSYVHVVTYVYGDREFQLLNKSL